VLTVPTKFKRHLKYESNSYRQKRIDGCAN
jgi:hypothetical protein